MRAQQAESPAEGQGGERAERQPPQRRISATALAQYVRFGNCDRLLYYTLYPQKARELGARWRVSEQPLTPLLHAEGEQFERNVVSRVRAAGETVIDLSRRDVAGTIECLRLAGAGRRVVLAQATLGGRIGDWPGGGKADLIWLVPQLSEDRAGQAGKMTLSAVVADVKSSLTERVEHRLQVGFYVRLLRQMAVDAGVPLVGVAGAVLHREAGTTLPVLHLQELDQFDLAPYELALDHLLAGPEAVASRVAGQAFDEVSYALSFKCDGCLFNGHCMHDSAGRESLTLVPYLAPAEQRLLKQHGIRTFRDLAALTLPAAPGQYHGPLAPAPGRDEQLVYLRSHWQLYGLDRHTQRARALVRSRDGAAGEPHEPVVNSGFGTLPADDAHPGLIKVFFDAQHDYVQDAAYLLAALVRGPQGECLVVEHTAAPADREAEGDVLARWVARVYEAVLAAAGAPQAHVHLYAYSRQDQSVLLAALRRHVGRIPAIGALFDLLTDTAALASASPLAQPMVSFLAEEVRDRMTLDVTCTSLHEVATRLGFQWTGPTMANVTVDFRRRFRARVFDSRRLVDVSDPQSDDVTGETDQALPAGTEPARTWIEGAARFRSQIPLEYAYGAWRCLPEPADRLQRALLQPYQEVTWEELDGFARHRLRALAHIEGRFRQKNRFPGKHPLPLVELAAGALAPSTLPRALEDFLLIEHHTRLQDLLLSYAQPIEQRAQTGRGMLVECGEYEELRDGSGHATCRVVFEQLGLDPVLAEQALRLKEGDWVVVNPAASPGPARLASDAGSGGAAGSAGGQASPAGMLHGRLARVETLEHDASGHLVVRLALTSYSGHKRVFAYWHRKQDGLRPGDFYTIDEMADDLNGDKLLNACRAAGDVRLAPNPLLAWIERAAGEALPHPQSAATPAQAAAQVVRLAHEVPPALAAHAAGCLATINAIETVHETVIEAGHEGPTARQAEAIAGHLDEAVLLIQGPPGSGKSHTLGWAILVRLAAARLAGLTAYRVAVSSKTHNAIAIVLESVAEKLALLRVKAPHSAFARAVDGIDLYKFETASANEASAEPEAPLSAVRHLELYAGRGQLDRILSAPWLIVGATPGGLYNAQRYRGLGGSDVPWDDRPFHLTVIDEASQVNVPEALLACAFGQPQGQALIVGDHRQMPPIVATEWSEEARRTVVDSEVYRSIFDFLRERGFPRVGLDRSFRLHRRLAEFLEEIIYRQDGIAFFSKREDVLDAVQTGNPFVDAVLDPAYPVVVVEHGDAQAQQFSQVELELMIPLLDACTTVLCLDTATGIGVVVPHRAQRAMLRTRFPALAAANAIDTVERFQGGERDVILVSATAADPDYILSEAEFLLNPNRLNVALSRPKRKLIVLAASTLFRVLASDPELFEQAALWKRLRYTFAGTPLWSGSVAGTTVNVLGRHAAL